MVYTYTYKDCICYDCDVFEKYRTGKNKENSIDCGCESAPMLLNECSYCDKREGCPTSISPDDKEDDLIDGWRTDPLPQRCDPFLIQMQELVHPEFNPKGIEICYFYGGSFEDEESGEEKENEFVVSHWCTTYDGFHMKIVKPVKWMELPDPGYLP